MHGRRLNTVANLAAAEVDAQTFHQQLQMIPGLESLLQQLAHLEGATRLRDVVPIVLRNAYIAPRKQDALLSTCGEHGFSREVDAHADAFRC